MFEKCPVLSIGRNDGSTEHPVRFKGTPHSNGIHLNRKPCGHTTVVDPHEHPNHHPELMTPPRTPEDHSANVLHFLQNGGHELLGYPDSIDELGEEHPDHKTAQATEVARLIEKHG